METTVRARYNRMLANDSLMWEGLGPDGVEGDYTEHSQEIARAIADRDALRLGKLLLNQVDDYIYAVAEAREEYDDDGELRAHIANRLPF